MQNDNRNLIAFVVMTAILVIAYQVFILGPQEKLTQAARAKAQIAAPVAAATAASAAPRLSRAQALAQSPRVVIDTPALSGSLALRGARIDDLFLKTYHTEWRKSSPPVELLRPEGMAQAYFAEQGWVGANLPGLPTPQTEWTLASGGVLSPGHPVVLTYSAPGGLGFTRAISVDDHAMFTITDTVANPTSVAATVAPFASVKRIGLPSDLAKSNIVHEGAIGILGATSHDLHQEGYKNWKKKGEENWPSTGGWLGITEKYWMTAFIPGQSEHIDAKVRVKADADPASNTDIYEAAYIAGQRTIAPGQQIVEVSHLFAGAKTVPLLNSYAKQLGIPRFDDAVDWGILWFLTKPIFTLLEFFYQHVGNFGVAILMLTVVIRLITFPLASRGFEMGIKMKKIQPELQAMQKRLKDDPAAQQKEMMALYAREKVNPVTGCLPILLQIPVFYSLTKLFTVTIEMRHAPFFGWIHDLSARDPTTIINLFGLIHWDPATAPLIGAILGGMLHVGVWPLAYGCAMLLSQSMTPQTGIDPTQQRIFALMPLIFTFTLAQFTVGLLIYWTWSNLLSILQQYFIMHRFGVDNPIDSVINRFRTPKAQE